MPAKKMINARNINELTEILKRIDVAYARAGRVKNATDAVASDIDRADMYQEHIAEAEAKLQFVLDNLRAERG